jgi:hypothetical protein
MPSSPPSGWTTTHDAFISRLNHTCHEPLESILILFLTEYPGMANGDKVTTGWLRERLAALRK